MSERFSKEILPFNTASKPSDSLAELFTGTNFPNSPFCKISLVPLGQFVETIFF